jgi:hypothetical protein
VESVFVLRQVIRTHLWTGAEVHAKTDKGLEVGRWLKNCTEVVDTPYFEGVGSRGNRNRAWWRDK